MIYIYIYLYCFISFPTCQVKVIRLYVSWPAAFLLLLLPPLDHNCKLQIAIFPAGPEQQAVDQSDRRTSTASSRPSVPRRTRTATSGSECSPPGLRRKLRIKVFPADLNREHQIRVLPAGHQPQRISEDIPDRLPERMSEDMPDTYARKNVIRDGIFQVLSEKI